MALFVLSLCPFDISVGVGAFVIGLSQISSFFSSNTNQKGHFSFHDKNNAARNSELRKVDISTRLLLREISYGSMITSYLDKVTTEVDRTEALQALVQIFNSMADITSRIIVNTVGARRHLYLQDMAFKSKTTESKLQSLSTVGPELFHGKYFYVLHTSAENIRDAKETQHLSSTANDSFQNEKKRKLPDSDDNDKMQNQEMALKVSKKFQSQNDSRSSRQNHKSQDRCKNHGGNNADRSADRQQSGFRTPKYR